MVSSPYLLEPIHNAHTLTSLTLTCINSPTICAIQAPDSWNYSSVGKAQQPNTSSISHNSYIAEQYIFCNKNHVLPLYVKFPCHKRAQHRMYQFLLSNEAIWGKHGEDDVELSGLTLQINSSTCLVLTLHTQLENYFLVLGRATAQYIPITLKK